MSETATGSGYEPRKPVQIVLTLHLDTLSVEISGTVNNLSASLAIIGMAKRELRRRWNAERIMDNVRGLNTMARRVQEETR